MTLPKYSSSKKYPLLWVISASQYQDTFDILIIRDNVIAGQSFPLILCKKGEI